MSFVLDNSVAMRWCFEDHSPYAEQVLEEMLVGEQAQVPVLWLYEVISVLAEAEQRTSSARKKCKDSSKTSAHSK